VFPGENTSPLAETLTESFCERCGTRYEFQAPTRLNPLRKTRGFIGGLRNYLTSQDDLSDAMGDAMRSEEDNLAAAQLEAFHESFNFCIDCRQYTCLNCWNNDAGRCRSCVPIPGTDDLAERLAASAVAAPPMVDVQAPEPVDELIGRPSLEAWPTSDLPAEAAIASDGYVEAPWPEVETRLPEPEPEPIVAEVEVEPLPEPAVAWQPESEEPEAELIVEPEPEPVVAELDRVFAEVEIEPEPAFTAWEPEPEPVVVELEAEPIIEPVAEPEPEPEPVRPALRVVAWDEDSAY
jgi:hypothetical protein